jgi:hypothetical protein
VKRYATDFGYDLDEEGHPLEEGEGDLPPEVRHAEPSGAEHSEEEAVPA